MYRFMYIYIHICIDICVCMYVCMCIYTDSRDPFVYKHLYPSARAHYRTAAVPIFGSRLRRLHRGTAGLKVFLQDYMSRAALYQS